MELPLYHQLKKKASDDVSAEELADLFRSVELTPNNREVFLALCIYHYYLEKGKENPNPYGITNGRSGVVINPEKLPKKLRQILAVYLQK